MTIVLECGIPDLFITMTCNPKWKEIPNLVFSNKEGPGDTHCVCLSVWNQNLVVWTQNLTMMQTTSSMTENFRCGQTAADRVFHMKLQELKDDLFKKEIFGKVSASIHVIEFEQRGLPHAHIYDLIYSICDALCLRKVCFLSSSSQWWY